MLFIKEKNTIPITTGEFEGDLIYNGREIYKGKIKVVKLVRGTFGFNFKIKVYKINNLFYYHEETDTLFRTEIEFNQFCGEAVKQIRNLEVNK